MVRSLLVAILLCTFAGAQQFSGGEVVTAQKTLKGDIFFALEFGGTAGGFGQFSYTPGGKFHLQKSGGEGICPFGSIQNPGCEFEGAAGLLNVYPGDSDCELVSFTVTGTLRIGASVTYNRKALYSQQLCNRNLFDEFSAGGSFTVHAQ